MPNWCNNKIDISGDSNIITQLLNSVKSEKTEFDFKLIIPPPSDDFTWEWSVRNWGTKWDANADDVPWISHDGETASISFNTAWSPCLPITLALSKKFPELLFKHTYEEGGMDFSGYVVFQNGETLEEGDGEYGKYPTHEQNYYDED